MALKKTDKKGSINRKLQQTPIAVIGVASVFPDARDANEFWDNIYNEVDAITDVPPSRWNIEDYYDPDPKAPDKTYSKRGGFIPDIDFNPMEFGLPPNILEVTDVSQLLALVVAKKVLEDAGYGDEKGYDRGNIGITLGVGGGQKLITPLTTRLQYPVWKRVLTKSGLSGDDADMIIEKIKKAYVGWEENSFPGMLGNVIAGRVANRLNLGGTNCVLDAACASSLTAIKMAVDDLLTHRSEIMIAGGVDTDNSPFMYMSFSKTPAFTDGEKSRPFDENSRGMLVGEGLGMVALKRLEDAERDNDRIYAVLKGIGTSSDGRFKSIYAPRPEGQARALRQAYEKAGIEPSTVGLIEAHGTGTVAGDNAEFTALKTVFGEDNPRKQHIALGSVKSQIGHTKAAAGSAGFIKAALALHHRILPATINVTAPHPTMKIEDTPFYLNTRSRPWLPAAEGHPRRAGVSSFGFGGTNFHVVLEEYTGESEGFSRVHRLPHAVVIAESSPEKLLTKCRRIGKDLASDAAEKAFFDLVTGCPMAPVNASDARLGFIARSRAEAAKLLETACAALEKKLTEEAWEHPRGIYYRKSGMDTKGGVVALFSGQGSQYPEMGRTLAINFPQVTESFGQMDRLFVEGGETPLSAKVYPIPKFTKEDKNKDTTALQDTRNAQPAIGAFSAGLFKILTTAGFSPDCVAGHSFGELTALWAAGVLSETDYYFLARARGSAMAAPDDPDFDAGTMLAVMGDVENLATDIADFPDITIANMNSRSQVVLAGPVAAIKDVAAPLKEKGYTVVPLPVSAAFHTPLVGHAQKPFAEAIGSVKFKAPKCPVYSNATGTPYPRSPEEIQEKLASHILESVRFREEIEKIHDNGGRIFVEFGPKNVLTKLTGNILSGKPHMAVALNASPGKCSDTQLRQAAVQLCVAGVPLSGIDPGLHRIQEPSETGPALMNIRLNGSNFVSDKTKKAYEDALNDGQKVAQAKVVTKIVEVPAGPAPAKPVSEKSLPDTPVQQKPAPENRIAAPLEKHGNAPEPRIAAPVERREEKAPAVLTKKPAPIVEKKGEPTMKKPLKVANPALVGEEALERIENSIGQFLSHRDETLRVHDRHLTNAGEYTKSFHDLMGQQLELLRQRPDIKIPESIERSMEMYHGHQGETLKSHVRYLELQGISTVAALDLLKEKYGAGVNGPDLSREPFTTAETAATQITPAPVAEIAQAPARPAAAAPAVEAATPAAQAATPTAQAATPTVQAATPAAQAATPAAQAATPTVPAAAPAIGKDVLTEAMLDVVADKTGYPSEMLELDMDMEADLGIDSIKRVEILAAVMNRFPDLPEVNPEELAPLKTLGQIVEKLTAQLPAAADATGTAPTQNQAAPAATGPGIGILTDTMLDVVADKTGYPSEMLELTMDMEADLGIDSIKRVEILAAVMDRFPELPEVNPDELAPLKTLGQIVEKLTAQLPAAADAGVSQPATGTAAAQSQAAPATATAATGPGIGILTDTMLDVVADKTGYPSEMLELNMDMEADLGIDSIKRVEILAAVMDQFPGLPEVNPDELAPLKTLGQIVEKLTAQLPAAADAGVSQPATGTAAAQSQAAPATATATTGPSIETMTVAMLDVVADKTGYPSEMLELTMDMEADLGIDSIKRVEILAAVMDRFPELPEVNPDELSPLKTLGQIVEKLTANLPAAANTGVSQPATGTAAAPNPATPAPEAATGPDMETLTTAMLEVVSEKTGYPVEMLELDMDMEAELGIDSIKRVEILAAVIDRFPNLPEVSPDELSALKTLGEVVERMAGACAAGSPSSEAAAPAPTKTEVLPTKTRRSVARLEVLPRPDFLEFDLPKGRICLITDDGTKMTASLSSALGKAGWKVVVLALPKDMVAGQAKLGKAVKRITLKDMQESTLTAALEKISGKYGTMGGFIHLNPAPIAEPANFFPEKEGMILQHVFLMAKHLKAQLTSGGPAERSFFMTVANLDGKLGTTGEGVGLVSGGLFGLTKTVNLEWPEVFCRAVDLSPGLDMEARVSAVIAELHDPDRRLVETGHGPEGRVTLVERESDAPSMEKNDSINASSVFLVSGGAKGVTARCAAELAKDHGCRFILMGRSDYSDADEPAWSLGIEEESELKKAIMTRLKEAGEKPTPKAVNEILKPILSDREIRLSIAAIKENGGTASYISADVTDRDAIAKQLAPVVEKIGGITGIIHGAGVLADKYIEQKTVSEYCSVYATKIQGLEALLGCVDREKLTHLALFSSAAGFFGNEGQSDYAMANEILNKTAYRFTTLYPDCHVNAFDWGPWDGGMVTPQLKRMFEERGIDVIPLDAGARIFSGDLSSAEASLQVIVGSSMIPMAKMDDAPLRSHRIARTLSAEENPFLNDHMIGNNRVLPTVCASWWMAEACEKLLPGFRFFSCTDYRLYKGIVFDETLADRYLLTIEEKSRDAAGTITLSARITSERPDGKAVNHYAATITVTNRIPEMPVYSGFDPAESGASSGSSLYKDGTLFHGPKFQAIERVLNMGDNKLTLECRLPEVSRNDQGQFPVGTFDPYASDPQFQCMLVWVRNHFGAGSLPTGAARAEQFARIPAGRKFYVSMDVIEKSEAQMKADITSHDEDGRVYIRVMGAAVTVSKQLNELFVKAV